MATAPQATEAPRLSFDRGAQVRAAIVAASFLAVFYLVLLDLAWKWQADPNWSHGWIIPLFSAWLVYHNWDKLRRTPVRGAWLGLPVMLAALALYCWSLWGVRIGYVRPFSMLLCLLGVIVLMCGLPAMRYLFIPWAYLFFAVPLPKSVYLALTDPLRRLAATASASVLNLVPGLEIQRKGSMLEYLYQGQFGILGVEDACSGMRSTVTLCALGVAVTFMSDRPIWQRVIMIAACVPIATFCNIIRVGVTCALHIFVDPRYATGTYHTALGLLMLLIAFGLFSGLGWVLNNLFIETPDEAPDKPAGEAPTAAGGR